MFNLVEIDPSSSPPFTPVNKGESCKNTVTGSSSSPASSKSQSLSWPGSSSKVEPPSISASPPANTPPSPGRPGNTRRSSMVPSSWKMKSAFRPALMMSSSPPDEMKSLPMPVKITSLP